MSTHYDPASGKTLIDWTPELAAFDAHLEATLGPSYKTTAKAPTPEQERCEPLIGIVYRLAMWGKQVPSWEDPEARLALVRLWRDADAAIQARNRAFAEVNA